MVDILNRGRFSTENRIIPGIQLVLKSWPLFVFAKSRRSSHALKSDIIDLLFVMLHERVLSFAERGQHRNSSYFKRTVYLKGPILHHVCKGPILLLYCAWPMNIGYVACLELFSFDALFTQRLLTVASLVLSILKFHVHILTWLSCCPHLHLKIVASFFKVFKSKIEFLHICGHSDLLVSCRACSWLP